MDKAENSDIVLEIDRELSSIVPDYIENRRLDTLLIEQLLSKGRIAEIRSLGHRMKGSGGSYGFDEISEIGEALECAAQVSDADGIRNMVESLTRYLSRVKVTYV